MTLRSEVIRLAHSNPELRKDLLPMVTPRTAGKSTGLKEFQSVESTLGKAAEAITKGSDLIDDAIRLLKSANAIKSDESTERAVRDLAKTLKLLDIAYDSIGEPLENVSAMVHELS